MVGDEDVIPLTLEKDGGMWSCIMRQLEWFRQAGFLVKMTRLDDGKKK